jgi:GNAT superfamily N-acetyltransferase
MTKTQKNYGVKMIREDMNDIPEFPIPQRYAIRTYRPGEGYIWTRIQKSAEPYINIDDELFDREFGERLKAMEERSFYLTTSDGEEIGTTTAWWQDDWRGQEWGQIHWVAIHADYQGRGLAKPMMSAAMQCLKKFHDRAFLGTSTGRIPAIKVYLDFGFAPDLESENAQAAWNEVASVLDHPVLKAYGFSAS